MTEENKENIEETKEDENVEENVEETKEEGSDNNEVEENKEENKEETTDGDGKETKEEENKEEEIDFSKDYNIDDSMLDKVKEVFSDIPKDKLDKIFEFVNGNFKETMDGKFQDSVKDWESEMEKDLKSDPEYGKNYIDNNLAAQEAFERFVSSKEDADFLKGLSVMKHPSMMRLFSKIGHHLRDDKTPNISQDNSSQLPRRADGTVILSYGSKK